MTKIVCNPFVKRQTPDSAFSHFAGSWEALEALAEVQFSEAKPGYKDGVMLVPVNPELFFSGTVKLSAIDHAVGEGPAMLTATFKARRAGEEAYLDVTARGFKMRAAAVDLVIYSKAVLGVDASDIPADYEIVSINARTTEAPEPMHPVTMMRNYFGLPGGTKAEYTAEQFAEAIRYWSQHAPCTP